MREYLDQMWDAALGAFAVAVEDQKTQAHERTGQMTQHVGTVPGDGLSPAD